MVHVLEIDGRITYRPFSVARAMIIRKEAVKLLDPAEAKEIQGRRSPPQPQPDKRQEQARK